MLSSEIGHGLTISLQGNVLILIPCPVHSDHCPVITVISNLEPAFCVCEIRFRGIRGLHLIVDQKQLQLPVAETLDLHQIILCSIGDTEDDYGIVSLGIGRIAAPFSLNGKIAVSHISFYRRHRSAVVIQGQCSLRILHVSCHIKPGRIKIPCKIILDHSLCCLHDSVLLTGCGPLLFSGSYLDSSCRQTGGSHCCTQHQRT